MGAVKRKVSELMQVLDREQKEAKRLPVIMGKLEHCLKEKPMKIIDFNLFLLQFTIEAEAARMTLGLPVVLISPHLAISVVESQDMESDFRLKRLKSEGFSILTLEQFQAFIKQLQSQVKLENYLAAIKFLKANARLWMTSTASVPSGGKAVEPRKRPVSQKRWKPTDFLPAPFPFRPFPKGLLTD